MMQFRNVVMVCVAMALVVGCGQAESDHDHDHDHDHENNHDHGGEGSDSASLEASCALMGGTASVSMSSSTIADAADHVIMASDDPVEVELGEGEAGYLTLNVPNEHSDIVFHVGPGAGLVAIHSGDMVVHTFGEGTPNTECASSVESLHEWHVHTGGMYVLEFEAGDARTATFVVEGAGEGHGDGGDHGDHGDHGG